MLGEGSVDDGVEQVYCDFTEIMSGYKGDVCFLKAGFST